MTDQGKEDAWVSDLLDSARTVKATPDDALMARVLADAARVAAEPVPVRTRPGLMAQLIEALGGWPSLGGVALAGCAGLWIGFAPPAAVEDLAAGVIGTTDAVTFLETDELFSEEVLSDG